MPARLRIASPAATSAPAHPAGQHRLARAAARSGLQRLGGAASGRSSPAASGSTSRPSLFGSRGRDLQRLGVALGAGVAEDVDRVAVAPVRRAGRRSSAADRLGRQRRPARPPPAISASVASTPGPPALVTMRQARPARAAAAWPAPRPCRTARRCVSTRSTPQRRKAASSTSSLPVSEPVCEAAALAAGLGAAGLDDDDRLGQRHLARGREERPRVADRLHVDDDAVGVRVVAEVVDQVAPADVEHRADRDEGAEADVLAQAPVEDGGAQGAALADEGDVARPGHARRRRWR